MEYIDIKWNDSIDISKEQWKDVFLNEELIKSYNKELICILYLIFRPKYSQVPPSWWLD